MRLRLLFPWGALLASAWAADGSEPMRRPLSPVARPGWTQVQLDAEAQRLADTAWIGDEEGRPVPFLRERDLPARDRAFEVRHLVTGTDESGRVTAEFSVAGAGGDSIVLHEVRRGVGPGGLGVTEDARTEMTFALVVDATVPWVAEVEVARKLRSGEWSTREQRVQLYDFGGGFRRGEFPVLREASEWRVRLKAVQGEVRGVRSVAARTAGVLTPLRSWNTAFGVTRDEAGWMLFVDGAQRVSAVALKLRGVVAPVRTEVWRLNDDGRRAPSLTWAGAAQVWRMPGLNSSEGEVRFGQPLLGERFRLQLPEKVELESAEAVVTPESLWFVAENGRSYFLHLAGQRQAAPGNLAALPTRLDEPPPHFLSIGPAEPDPFGQPVKEDLSVRAQRWLPWIVGVAVALLAMVALRMLRKPAQGLPGRGVRPSGEMKRPRR